MIVYIVSMQYDEGFGSPLAVFSNYEKASQYVDRICTDKRFDRATITKKQVDELA